jgi:predicted cation transporter
MKLRVFKTRNILLTTEKTKGEIVSALMDEFKIQKTTAYKLFNDAKAMLMREMEDEQAVVMKGLRNELFHMLDSLRESNNAREMLTAIKVIMSLYGLEDKNINVKVSDESKLKEVETSTLLEVISSGNEDKKNNQD